MDLLRERLKARGAQCAVLCGGGGDSSTSTTTEGAKTTTVNTDKRVAVQDGIGTTGDGNMVSYTSTVNSSDAVVAIAKAGADVINSSGGAVVDLFKDAGKTYSTTIEQSANLIDKLLDKASEGFALSTKVVDSFTPNENKNTDAIKTAAIAAGVIGVAMLFGKKS
ncbi:hypothetical protein [Polaromonas sp.]|uniref:hypothetical protein n=1 Tax=Polaromonas sp. TaxID=1869339 RepID=UPI002730A9D6|nr:hypothetical protein [Polaromonas sp.]MDP1740084.1 hypothetical protein [Polaromonas sp.]